MSHDKESVRLVQGAGYRFGVSFGAAPDAPAALQSDLPPPLGQGLGPSPEQFLAAAVGNCLSASLLFAFRKFKQEPGPLTTEVEAETGRNAEGRMRVLALRARITLGVPVATLAQAERVLGSFEAFCTVTQSVAAGIPVTLSVFDSTGAPLK